MKAAAFIVTAAATLALAFGAWGRFSVAGRRELDEMAGILPLFSWYAGWVLAAAAADCCSAAGYGASPRVRDLNEVLQVDAEHSGNHDRDEYRV